MPGQTAQRFLFFFFFFHFIFLIKADEVRFQDINSWYLDLYHCQHCSGRYWENMVYSWIQFGPLWSFHCRLNIWVTCCVNGCRITRKILDRIHGPTVTQTIAENKVAIILCNWFWIQGLTQPNPGNENMSQNAAGTFLVTEL